MKKFRKFVTVLTFMTFVCLFSCVTAFAATLPKLMSSPEDGWKRFNDTDTGIIAYGANNPYTYNEAGGNHDTHYGAKSIKFNFTGTKIRLIYLSQLANDTISIDGAAPESMANLNSAGQTFGDPCVHDDTCVYEKTDLKNCMHSVSVAAGTGWESQFSAVDIGSDSQLYPYGTTLPTYLTATTANGKVNLSWDTISGATGYTIQRGTKSGVYDTTFNTTNNSYVDTSVQSNTTYYYVVSATTSSGNSGNSNEATATPQKTLAIDVTSSADKVKVGSEFTSDIVLNNASNILAEDVTFTYDKTLFQYEGYTDITGLKVQKITNDTATGTVRFIAASLGGDNAITGNKSLIQLKFKAIAPGTGKIDATKGRVADQTTETDISADNCGEKSITVENAIIDVNKSGEYTLVDLADDAFYYGKNAADTDTVKYNADQNSDGKIDDSDLSYVVSEILANTNYGPNNS